MTPAGVKPYPVGRDEISDLPASDKGKNFGRIARIVIMDDYVNEFRALPLLGIAVSDWREFFKSGLKERSPGVPSISPSENGRE